MITDKEIQDTEQLNEGNGQAMIDDLNTGTSANYGGNSNDDNNSDNPLTNYTTGGVQDLAGPGFGGNTGATAVDLDKKVDEMLEKQESNKDNEEDNMY